MVHSKSEISMVLCDFYFHIKFHRSIKIVYFIIIIVVVIWKLIWSRLSGSDIDIILSIIGLAVGIGYIYSYFGLINLIKNLKIYYGQNRVEKVIDKIREVHPKITEEIKKIISSKTSV